MNRNRRFVIVDPSLKDGRGHHYELALRITKSALASNLKPIWLCNKNFILDVKHSGVDILPALNVSLYDAYKTGKRFDSLSSLRFPRIFISLYRFFCRILNAIKKENNRAHDTFARDLLSSIDLLSLTSSDRLLFHTADGMTYAALDKLIRERSHKTLPIFHVCTPYDPIGVMPNLMKGFDISQIVNKWSQSKILDSRIFLYGENHLLAEHLSKIWSITVRPLELPAIQVPNNQSTTLIAKSHIHDNHRLEVVYLGPARIEKGFHLIPDIVQCTIEFLRQEGFRENKVNFTLQCSPQIVGYPPQVLKAIERLRTYGKNIVTLVSETLSTEGYLSLLARAHVVLLPYGVHEYRVRSSGIVSEALSLNKIIVTTTGTYPAAAITHGGGATGTTPRELARAIFDIACDLPRFIANAQEQGKAYRKRNTGDNYVLNCLNTESSAIKI
jgi:glycosyltransferase involved in cell wall biosynthesis